MRTCVVGKAGSTLRSSRAVPHPSTNRALRRLTSEVGRDPVHSTRYGRQRWQPIHVRLTYVLHARSKRGSAASREGAAQCCGKRARLLHRSEVYPWQGSNLHLLLVVHQSQNGKESHRSDGGALTIRPHRRSRRITLGADTCAGSSRRQVCARVVGEGRCRRMRPHRCWAAYPWQELSPHLLLEFCLKDKSIRNNAMEAP